MGKSRFYSDYDPSTFLLAFFWFAGLILGAWMAQYADESLLSLMRLAVCGRVSIVGLLICSILPFLFIALAIYTSGPKLVFPLCFFHAFSFTYTAFCVFRCFGSAGWLVHLLFRFSAICLLPFYWWFAYRQCRERGECLRNFMLCCTASVFVCGLDYFVICPLLGSLIDV